VGAGAGWVRTGRWRRLSLDLLLGRDVHGAILGIVGVGRIGQAVARRAKGFGMRILLYGQRADPRVADDLGGQWVELGQLLRQSDFVSLHVPLTAETRHMIGSQELAMMKPTAYLINTARGPVVDEAALVQALRKGRIAGAGLDVYENEPRVSPGLKATGKTVLLPHLGSATVATRRAMAILAVENLTTALAGRRPPNLVNPEVLEGRS
jgi:glyoxylate reductase